MDGKSGVRQLVASEGLSLPIISSDRSRVAYRVQRDDHSELWTVRWDGTDATLLLNERELPVSDLPAGYTERRLNDVRWLPGRNYPGRDHGGQSRDLLTCCRSWSCGTWMSSRAPCSA